tara:strand:- start:347 stop:1093 length:747 start_codon:yes stop_codon:yes gene_type:complete
MSFTPGGTPRAPFKAQHTVTLVGADGGEVVAANLPTMEPPSPGATFANATPATISITEAINLPPATPPAPPLDGLEGLAGPMISLTEITMPSSYLGESLTGLPSAPNNTAAGTFPIFPNVNLVVVGPVGSAVQGVGSAVTTATISGSITELNSWVEQWTPTASVPKFDGSDYAKVKSEGYGRDNGAFIISFKLKFDLAAPLAGHPSAVESTYTIKILNNFDNDRDQYKQDYENAYKSLTKVPELSERD